MSHVTRFALPPLLIALCMAPPLAQASGSVEVQWIDSERYSDAGRNSFDRERALTQLAVLIQGMGRLLPDGQTLKLEVTDLDLAGELRPWHGQELRVMRGGADWPRMSLRYTLSAGGQTLRSGQAQLSDFNYLWRPLTQELGYEKRMLEQWVVQSIAPASAAARSLQ